jgi:hypothetical protein
MSGLGLLAGIAGSVIGAVALVLAGLFAARATRAAAATTAEAQRAAAIAAADPAQRAADLAAFQAIREDMQQEIDQMRGEMTRVRGLLYSLSRWALHLRDQVTELGGTPEPPPSDVDDYYRTGV